MITDRLAGRLESLVFGEDRAATRSGVWNQVNTVFSAVQQDIAYPIDHQFDAIEDSLPILYSAERFACQDYLPWKGGNP